MAASSKGNNLIVVGNVHRFNCSECNARVRANSYDEYLESAGLCKKCLNTPKSKREKKNRPRTVKTGTGLIGLGKESKKTSTASLTKRKRTVYICDCCDTEHSTRVPVCKECDYTYLRSATK